MSKAKIMVLAGPTASGKSALALEIAEKTGAVIINADAMQVYRELRVLTARPSEADEARAPHRLYGFLAASDPCSAGKWQRWARMEIDWAIKQGKPALVVGGTGLYLKALMQGIAEIPAVSPAVRAQAASDREAMGAQAFYERLCHVDPVLGAKLKAGDTQRCLRAYEVWLETAKPLSWWQGQGAQPPYAADLFDVFSIIPERAELYRRCDARFDVMLENGAMDEVKALLSLKLSPDLPAMRAVGVPEIGAHLRGEMTLEQAVSAAKQATRNYAKRQLTWIRHQLPQARDFYER